MTTMIKLARALGQVTLDEFITWSARKQARNLLDYPSNKGKPAWNRGQAWSDEVKKNISNGKKNSSSAKNWRGKCRIIEGLTISEWSKKLGVSRPRVVYWYETRKTMTGCVPGKVGGWNKGIKTKDTK